MISKLFSSIQLSHRQVFTVGPTETSDEKQCMCKRFFIEFFFNHYVDNVNSDNDDKDQDHGKYDTQCIRKSPFFVEHHEDYEYICCIGDDTMFRKMVKMSTMVRCR